MTVSRSERSAGNEADELPQTLPVLQDALSKLEQATCNLEDGNASTAGTAHIARAPPRENRRAAPVS